MTQEQIEKLNECVRLSGWKNSLFSWLEWPLYRNTVEYKTLCKNYNDAKTHYNVASARFNEVYDMAPGSLNVYKTEAQEKLNEKRNKYERLKSEKDNFLASSDTRGIWYNYLNRRKYYFVKDFIWDNLKGDSFKYLETVNENFSNASWNMVFAKIDLGFAKLLNRNVDIKEQKYNDAKSDFLRLRADRLEYMTDIFQRKHLRK